MRDLLRLKLSEALTSPVPPLTRRDVRLPGVPGKALAVIGVRRCGKTTLLWQCLADRLAAGVPREALLLLDTNKIAADLVHCRSSRKLDPVDQRILDLLVWNVAIE